MKQDLVLSEVTSRLKAGFHGGTSHAELDCRPNLHRSNRRNIMEVICTLCKLCKEKST